MRIEGVYVAIVTPFDARNEIDRAALKRHLEWLAAMGVDGFVPCGTTGESAVLSREERRTVIELTVEVAKAHGKKVIAGCGGNNTASVLELIREAKTLECEAVLVVTPYYNKPTPRGLEAHYTHLAKESGFPIIMYNVPGRTAVSLPVETIMKLFELENIIGIKEASGQYATWLQLSQAMDTQAKSLLAGDDDSFAPIQALGGCGIISASANVAPAAFVKLSRLMSEGKWLDAFRLQKKLYPLVRAMFLETSPAPAKQALAMMGKMSARLRLPLVEVGSNTSEVIGSVLKSLELMS